MVTRVLAALLGSLVMAGSVVLLGAAPAQACRCVQQDVAQQARAADLVVSGTVAGVRQGGQDAERGTGRQQRPGGQQGQQDQQNRREQGRSPFGSVTLVVDVDRVYAGEAPDATIDVTTAAAPTACGLGRLPRGEEYVFFLTADARTLRASTCGGSAPATDREVAQVERILGEGRAVAGAGEDDAEPAAADLTVVDDTPPPDAVRTALPGGILAAAALVGLLVLGRVGSRR